MHEIVTLQLGQPSNYLATHFWNAQESYFTYSETEEPLVDHDVHWRPGIGADGSETFMPRTVIYDLKGGFGSLKKINALYEVQDEGPPPSLWNGPTVVQRLQPIEASAYQQSLDQGLEPAELTTGSVRYWSDFNRVFFHPRSVVQLNEYELYSTVSPFEKWSTGEDLFASLDKEHDLLDRDLRPFAEEADHMQGMQIMTTVDDAWGGFASRYAERLRDEYGKLPFWVWALQEPFHGVPREKRLLRLVNKAKSLVEIYRQASLVVPLAVPESLRGSGVVLDPGSQWHTSALLSAALESATLPARLRDAAQRGTLGAVADLLNVHGRQTVANLQMSVAGPGGVAAAPRAEDVGDDPSDGVRLDLDFRPADELAARAPRQIDGDARPAIFSQVLASRGGAPREDKDEDYAPDGNDPAQRRRRGERISRRYRSPLAYPILDSFPGIFRGEDGRPLAAAAAVTTSLSTDAALSGRLRGLRAAVVRSVGLEDREALGNDLLEMADEYHEGWSSGSDDGEDD